MAAAGPAQRGAEAVAGNPQALMSVRGLGIRFKTSQGVWQATRKIDFDIAPGERVGIVGESGCGKTITGLSILKLLPNNFAGLDGSILFDGIDLASCSTRATARRAWLILYTHDVVEPPSPFGCTPAALKRLIEHALAAEAEVVTVAEGARRLTG